MALSPRMSFPRLRNERCFLASDFICPRFPHVTQMWLFLMDSSQHCFYMMFFSPKPKALCSWNAAISHIQMNYSISANNSLLSSCVNRSQNTPMLWFLCTGCRMLVCPAHISSDTYTSFDSLHYLSAWSSSSWQLVSVLSHIIHTHTHTYAVRIGMRASSVWLVLMTVTRSTNVLLCVCDGFWRLGAKCLSMLTGNRPKDQHYKTELCLKRVYGLPVLNIFEIFSPFNLIHLWFDYLVVLFMHLYDPPCSLDINCKNKST